MDAKTPKITEKEIALIKRAQGGDQVAFSKLYKQYKGFVESILYQYLKDWDESQDLANIVFLKVYNKLSTFVTYDTFGGWLRRIANNTAIDYIRASKHSAIAMGDEVVRLTSASSISSNETDLVNRMTYEQLIEEFEKLPEVTRKIFQLFYIDNLSISQISKRLDLPKGTVKSTLSRTRVKLKQKFKKL